MNETVYLRAFEYSDLNLLNTIRNDNSLFQTTGGNKYYISSEYDKKWIEDKIFNNYHQLYLMICCKESNKPIGYICATNIDYINRKAEIGGIVIAPEHNSKGFGTGAAGLFVEHLFEELGLNMLYAFVKEDNMATPKLFEYFGGRKEGEIRDFIFKQNRYYNTYIFSILHSEYKNYKNKKLQIIEKL